MVFSEVPVPEVYKESADFRFFLKWIELCFTEIQNKTDNLIDLLDPLRCPSNLLWMLGDTCGYVYDDRVSIAFNRLVILYFAKLIRYKGSQTGLTLAAEMNLAEFNLLKYAEEDEILSERLEDTSIPVNSVSVNFNSELGYIDIVYYSENEPIDVCTEYVRPLGMYCFSHAGVAVNARTKVSVDARLSNLNDGNIHPGPAFIGHYRRADYASMQRFVAPDGTVLTTPDKWITHPEMNTQQDDPILTESDDNLLGSVKYRVDELKLQERQPVFYRNSDYEKKPNTGFIDPGYRSLCSLQLSNNEHIVKALLPSLQEPEKIFDIGYGPQNVETVYPDSYLKYHDDPMFNLRINRDLEESFTPQVYTVEYAKDVLGPKPGVNPPMAALGDAISLNRRNTAYTVYNKETGKISTRRLDEEE